MDKTDNLTRSLILALSVCYHARLQERAQYEKGVVSQFTAPLTLPGKEKQFQMEIRRYMYACMYGYYCAHETTINVPKSFYHSHQVPGGSIG